MNLIEEKVLRYIKDNKLIEEGDHVVLGVSGGADSMCLLRCLWELKDILKLRLTAVHIHHGVRGQEADEDKAYVENYCRKEKIEILTYSYNVPAIAAERGTSVEEAGRDIRYETFYSVKEQLGAHKIGVAHNCGDNAETIIHNICRGTGLEGLAGIPVRRDCIVRPIMCLERNEIEAYLKEKGVQYKTDSTNLENEYTRNKIRNIVIPYLRDNVNDRAGEHIGAMGELVRAAQDYIGLQGKALFENIAQVEEERISINGKEFANAHQVLQGEVVRIAIELIAGRLKDITMKHIKAVIAIGTGQTGKKIHLPYNVVAVKYPEELIIKRSCESDKEAKPVKSIRVEKLTGQYQVETAGARMIFEQIEPDTVQIEEKTYTKWLCCDILKDNLEIRTRQAGDYFIVNDQGGKKKLKDYFIDEKIPKEQRDNILLLASGSHVLWIVGYRISEACKVNDNSRNIVKVHYVIDSKEL